MVLDLKLPLHFRILKTILRTVDVILEGYLPGTLEKMGLEPKELLKINSKLIICRITGYGQTGPYSAYSGQDINFLGVSGVLSSFGQKDVERPDFHGNILVHSIFKFILIF